MIWQDVVIAIANLLFVYSLTYQAYHGYKKKKASLTLTASGLTAVGLYAMTVTFFTLSLYFSTVVVGVSATLWLILFLQAIIYRD